MRLVWSGFWQGLSLSGVVDASGLESFVGSSDLFSLTPNDVTHSFKHSLCQIQSSKMLS